MKSKIAITLNTARNLVNSRSGLMRASLDASCEVVVVAPPDESISRLLKRE